MYIPNFIRTHICVWNRQVFGLSIFPTLGLHLKFGLYRFSLGRFYCNTIFRWGFMVFKATFNNISLIWWLSNLLVEETGENHRHVASHLQTLSHNVVSSSGIEVTTSVVICTDCTCSCQTNHHTITTSTAPICHWSCLVVGSTHYVIVFHVPSG
jgi:hypothetical protein